MKTLRFRVIVVFLFCSLISIEAAFAASGPSVTGLSPTSGPVGTSVTISGSEFGSSQGTSAVQFNGNIATVTSWSASTIVATVPNAATTGNLVVTVSGSASNGLNFTVVPGITLAQAVLFQNSLSVSISSAQTAGNYNVLALEHYGQTVDSVTDTVGNVYTRVCGPLSTNDGRTTDIEFWFSGPIAAAAPATNTVTVNVSGTPMYKGAVLYEVHSPTALVFDQCANLVTRDAASASSGTTGTTRYANSFMIAVTNPSDLSITPPGFPWIGDGDPAGTSSSYIHAFVGTAGTYSATWTSGTSQDWNSAIAVFGALPLPPTIGNISPTSGMAGTPVTISGTSFGATQGASTVTFNGIAATPTNWGGTNIEVPVPAGAMSGNVVVSVNGVASNGVNFTVGPALAISNNSLPNGSQGTSYSATLNATGGMPPYTWSIFAGALLDGLSLDSNTGTITGFPASAGTINFTVQVRDANGATATQAFSITSGAPPVITTTTLRGAILNVAYSTTVQASGGVTPYVWSVSAGVLPTGLSLNANTGAITGTPTVVGISNFTVQATDANAGAARQALSITVGQALSINAVLPNATQNVAYAAALTVSGGVPPYTWTIVSGILPLGLSLNTSTGAITGTPTTVGTSNFEVQVTDSAGNVSSQIVIPKVNPPRAAAVITGISAGGNAPEYVNYTSGNNASYSATIGEWDTPYAGGLQGPPSGPEPFGTSIWYADIDVKDGGKAIFSYSLQTYDTAVWDWLDIYLVLPDGSEVSVLSDFGKPGTDYGPYWAAAPIRMTVDLTPYKQQHLRLAFSVRQDNFGDQTQAAISNLHLQSSISGPDTVWWFNGETPSGYDTQITLTSTPGTNIQWNVIAGQSEVNVAPNGNTLIVTSSGTAFSASPGEDVLVTVQVDGEISDPFAITTRKPTSFGDKSFFNSCNSSSGYETTITYPVEDQIGDEMKRDIYYNEQWTSGPTYAYSGSNWQQNPVRGGITTGYLIDRISGPGVNNVPANIPMPTCSGTPAEVVSWGQDWRVGSTASGNGVKVHSDTLVKYTEHGDHR